ncbi:hypothetical protein [Piscinibacter sakaiensis]|uniref:Uncharacterized protein n=1 Tax=Piscinibacter sakaiensis TaxID=1547922 RepID=A0A0K8P842_PISS1|nr:hypothetical protein [Piscinibacter sakaiensis]GAP38370.1 hypothetical protein ISF6_4828 [Piscinibacter sakaiensis]
MNLFLSLGQALQRAALTLLAVLLGLFGLAVTLSLALSALVVTGALRLWLRLGGRLPRPARRAEALFAAARRTASAPRPGPAGDVIDIDAREVRGR